MVDIPLITALEKHIERLSQKEVGARDEERPE